MLLACLAALCLAALPAGRAQASSTPSGTDLQLTARDTQGLGQLLALVSFDYAAADPGHEVLKAAVARRLAADVSERLSALAPALEAADRSRAATILGDTHELVTGLGNTGFRFQPWPLSLQVKQLTGAITTALDAITTPLAVPARPYREIDGALQELVALAAAGQRGPAGFAALRAYALYADGPGRRLQGLDPALDRALSEQLALGSRSAPALSEMADAGAPAAAIEQAVRRVRSQLPVAEQALGEVKISHATIVANAAIIVFREGLEAILILAAITASFVGAKRHLRRPVLLGAIAGLGATAITWVIAQIILKALSGGGLQLQAITGLIAIAVLLLVTNWFFHRVYWSEWISRFNRRRRTVEGWSTFGLISGQALGLALLGLSSVYREGLETVLFLQAMQASAGTGATILGAGIGLAATFIVGAVTFKMQRRLPFKRMLIVTGALIALVLAVMVGTTVHNLQGIGWISTTPTGFQVPNAWSMWLGVYGTWEGIGAQLGALLFVVGSYLAAREIRVKRPQRRARAALEMTSLIPGAEPSGRPA